MLTSIDKLINRICIKYMIFQGNMALKDMESFSHNTKEHFLKTLDEILKNNADTEYGKKYDFKSISTYDDFKSKVPITEYDDYKKYIDDMTNNNAKNVLTSSKIVGYAITSGTTGKSKYIPLTNEHLNPFKKYTITRALALANKNHYKKTHKKLKPGKGLNAINCPLRYISDGIPCGDISQHAALKYEKVYSYIVSSPLNTFYNSEYIDLRYANLRWALEDENLIYSFADFFNQHQDRIDFLKQNWEMIVNDIEHGTIDKSIYINPKYYKLFTKNLKPNKNRASYLRKVFSEGFSSNIIKKIWPNMAVWTGIGTATFERSLNKVKKYLDGVSCDLSIYGGSEGLYGVVYELESKKVQLLPDSLFLEFRDINSYDKVLLSDEIELGKEYEVIITNRAGFYRYTNGDIIKVVGFRNDCPLITFSKRKANLLNIAGDKTTEKHFEMAIEDIENEFNLTFKEWAVYEDSSVVPHRYKVLVETTDSFDLKKISNRLDELLCKHNNMYELVKHDISNSVFGLQKINTHEKWKNYKVECGASDNALKPLHIINTQSQIDFFTNPDHIL